VKPKTLVPEVTVLLVLLTEKTLHSVLAQEDITLKVKNVTHKLTVKPVNTVVLCVIPLICVMKLRLTSSYTKTIVLKFVQLDSGVISPTDSANHVTKPVTLAPKPVTNLVPLVMLQDIGIKVNVSNPAHLPPSQKTPADVANHVTLHVTTVTETEIVNVLIVPPVTISSTDVVEVVETDIGKIHLLTLVNLVITPVRLVMLKEVQTTVPLVMLHTT
jgi:hypothetical protein